MVEERAARGWLIAGVALLFALTVLWSVDYSFRYIFAGATIFCFFQFFLKNRSRLSLPSGISLEQQYRPSAAWVFWQDVREFFKGRQFGNPEQQKRQGRAIVLLVLGFIFFVFFIITMGVIFSDGNSSDDNRDNYARATEYFNTQQYDSANYYYRLTILNEPNNPVLYLERGNTFFNLSQNDSALIMYRQAVELDPEYEEAQYNIGLVLYNQKSYRMAIDETKKILDYSSGYLDAMLLIGDCYYSQIQLDSAMRWYEGAYANGYRSAGLSHVMAYIFDTKGQTDKAIELYKEAIGQDSTRTDIYRRLGELLPGEEGEWYRSMATGTTEGSADW